MPSDTNKNDPSSLLDDLVSDIIKGVRGVSKSNCILAGELVINALLLASSTGIEYSIPNTSFIRTRPEKSRRRSYSTAETHHTTRHLPRHEGGRNQPSISSPIIYKVRTSEQMPPFPVRYIIKVLSILHYHDEMLSMPFKNVELVPLLIILKMRTSRKLKHHLTLQILT